MTESTRPAVDFAPGGKGGLPALTGVRALAAAMVYLHHYVPAREVVGNFLHSFFLEMHAGVTLFFVLSGFLIYLRHSTPASLHRGPLIRYCFHRFARIYPMYFLVVVGMAVWTLVYFYPIRFSAGQIATLFLLQLTFLRGFSNQFKFIGVGQGWTLTVEVTFYVLFPLLLLVIRRVGFLATLAMTYAVGLLLYWIGRLVHFDEYFTPFQFMLIYTFFGRAGDFFAGMMLADYVRRASPVEKPGAGGMRSKWRLPLYTVLGGLGIAACLSALALLEPNRAEDGVYNPLGAAVYLLTLPPFVCALFYGLITERTWFSRLLGSRWLVLMGASSYCFYLIHVGGPHYILSNWVHECGLIPGYLALVLISMLLWKFVEEPFRRLILSHHLFRAASSRPPGS